MQRGFDILGAAAAAQAAAAAAQQQQSSMIGRPPSVVSYPITSRTRAYVTHVDFLSKDLKIWVQFDMKAGKDMELHLSTVEKTALVLAPLTLNRGNLNVGSKVLARFHLDDSQQKLYRSVVTKVNDDDTAMVHYMDYGNDATVSISQIFDPPSSPMPIFGLEPLAKQCLVDGVIANGDQWSLHAVEFLQQAICYEEVDVEILGKLSTKLVVNVYLENGQIKLADQLIRNGYGLPRQLPVVPSAVVPMAQVAQPAQSQGARVGSAGLANPAAAMLLGARPPMPQQQQATAFATKSLNSFAPVQGYVPMQAAVVQAPNIPMPPTVKPQPMVAPAHTGFKQIILKKRAKEPCVVSYINDPEDFYIQLTSSDPDLAELQEAIAAYASHPGQPRPPAITKGMACIALFREDQRWYRATVTEIHGAMFKVYYVDYGNEGVVSHGDILAIPPAFLQKETMAIKCLLFGLPGHGIWADDEIEAFHRVLKDPGGSLIALVHDFVNDAYSVELFNSHRANINSMMKEQLDQLEEQRRASKVPDAAQSRPGAPIVNEVLRMPIPDQRQSVGSENAPADVTAGAGVSSGNTKVCVIGFPPLEIPAKGDDFVDVIVSYVDASGKFFVQLKRNEAEIEKLSEKLNTLYASTSSPAQLPNPSRGQICAAKYSVDQRWYRGLILQRLSPTQLEVFFADYGNTEKMSKGDVKELRPDCSQLPPQAVECKLDGVDFSSEPGLVEKFRAAAEAQEMVIRLVDQEGAALRVVLYKVLNNESDYNINEYLIGKGPAPPSAMIVPNTQTQAPTDIAQGGFNERGGRRQDDGGFGNRRNDEGRGGGFGDRQPRGDGEGGGFNNARFGDDRGRGRGGGGRFGDRDGFGGDRGGRGGRGGGFGGDRGGRGGGFGGQRGGGFGNDEQSGGFGGDRGGGFGGDRGGGFGGDRGGGFGGRGGRGGDRGGRGGGGRFGDRGGGRGGGRFDRSGSGGGFGGGSGGGGFGGGFSDQTSGGFGESASGFGTSAAAAETTAAPEGWDAVKPTPAPAAAPAPVAESWDTAASDTTKKDEYATAYPAAPKLTGTIEADLAYVEQLPKFFLMKKSDADQLTILSEELRSSFDKLETLSNAKVGDVCCAMFDGEPYRATIVKLKEGDEAIVLFVDYGNSETKKLTEIKKLPTKLAQLYPTAIPAVLDGVSDVQKAEESSEKFQEMLEGADPLQVKVKRFDEQQKSYVVDVNLGGEAGDVAVALGLKEKADESQVEETPAEQPAAPAVAATQSEDIYASSYPKAPKFSGTVEVDFAFIDQLPTFFVMKKTDAEALNGLAEELQAAFDKSDVVQDPKVGDVCCALFDDQPYRAQVAAVKQDSGEVEVLFVDYGNRETKKFSDIKKLPKKMAELYPMAISAMLDDAAIDVDKVQDVTDKFNELLDGVDSLKINIKRYDDQVNVYAVDLIMGEENQDVAAALGVKQSNDQSRMEAEQPAPAVKQATSKIMLQRVELHEGNQINGRVINVRGFQEFWVTNVDSSGFEMVPPLIADYAKQLGGTLPLASDLEPGQLCLVLTKTEESGDAPSYSRAVVTNVTDGGNACDVLLIDQGLQLSKPVSEIFDIPGVFTKWPPQATKCKLDDVDSGWLQDEQMIKKYVDLVNGKSVTVTVKSIMDSGLGVHMTIAGEDVRQLLGRAGGIKEEIEEELAEYEEAGGEVAAVDQGEAAKNE